jgi:hypothetical protein
VRHSSLEGGSDGGSAASTTDIVFASNASAVLRPLVKRSVKAPAAIKLDGEEGVSAHVAEDDSASDNVAAASTSADERTPLLVPAAHNAPVAHIRHPHWTDKLNPLIIAGLVAIAIAVIPGVQNFLFGPLTGGQRNAGWVGATLGTVLAWLGGSYAIIELLGAGGELRFRDKNAQQEKTLGAVLSITLWRFAAIPAIGITAVWGLQHLSPAIYPKDPVLVRDCRLALSSASCYPRLTVLLADCRTLSSSSS